MALRLIGSVAIMACIFAVAIYVPLHAHAPRITHANPHAPTDVAFKSVFGQREVPNAFPVFYDLPPYPRCDGAIPGCLPTSR